MYCFPHTTRKVITDTLTLILNFDKMSFRWGISERFEVRCSRFICEGSCHKMTTVQSVIVTDIWHGKFFCRSCTSVFSSQVVILLADFFVDYLYKRTAT